ncbi:MAG: hypothetical protein OXB89_05765 [Anaerolineaceae bacterium]|nr:hypothetical protein [Anaerolineaceae bacterium]
MTRQYDLKKDLREAEAMVAGLENYLRGDPLYGSVGGGFSFQHMPALTVGALELRRRRLGQLAGDALRQRVDAVQAQREAVCEAWPLHYRRKLEREAHSRLDTTGRYLQDMAGEPAQATRNWQPELLRRSIVEELHQVMARAGRHDETLEAKARRIDALLLTIADEPCDFLWDPQLEAVYPPADFPWLYRRPRA